MAVIDFNVVLLRQRLASVEGLQNAVGNGERPTNGIGRLVHSANRKCPQITSALWDDSRRVGVERIDVVKRDRPVARVRDVVFVGIVRCKFGHCRLLHGRGDDRRVVCSDDFDSDRLECLAAMTVVDGNFVFLNDGLAGLQMVEHAISDLEYPRHAVLVLIDFAEREAADISATQRNKRCLMDIRQIRIFELYRARARVDERVLARRVIGDLAHKEGLRAGLDNRRCVPDPAQRIEIDRYKLLDP